MNALSFEKEEPPIVEAKGLHVHYPVSRDWLGRSKTIAHAINGLDIEIANGETVGILGESGCGKSTLARAIVGLAPQTIGAIYFRGANSRKLRGHAKRTFQKQIQLVFQDPQSSLNPRFRVWQLISEPIRVQQDLSSARRKSIAAELARAVGLSDMELDKFPHEFSGGQRQRIAIARALASDPDLIILDEPTSALDVSIQAQILNLLTQLQVDRGLSYLLISHDVSVVNHMCDRVAVMYLGSIVEEGLAEAVLGDPRHPYTRKLIDSVPTVEEAKLVDDQDQPIELPSNRALPPGCGYVSQCRYAAPECRNPQELKPVSNSDPTRKVRCVRSNLGELW